jgi:hypothetical protein
VCPGGLPTCDFSGMVFNTDRGSVGFGLDLLINIHFRDEMSGGDALDFDVPPRC